ncbi:hypothetical protein CLU83_3705 [Flavobacterium sp. 1]|uniref:hypothetical protein n=1 Tax=Flavobacterium sp. 1 TaxID=2035200 RepID=UPI000C239DC1|nr:hypothetical protein [Flavobacterium sp. 1]PJJ10303.1 hypothetical protein CLU83_3705 [Flavobacterium sp. 1]
MTDNNEKKYGRTLFDVIAEHPKWTVYIFAILVVTIILLAFLRVPIKIGDFEVGQNKSVIHDTILKTKVDTLFVEKKTIVNKPNFNVPKLQKEKSKNIMSSTPTGQTNINTGTNNGIVGDNGTINNNGIQPRKITEQDFEIFKSNYPDKTIQINFRIYGMADAEIYNVKKQIITLLKSNGYNKIEEPFLVVIGVDPPSRITVNKTSNGVIFEIPPAQQ